MKPSPTISVPNYDCRLTFSLFYNPIVVRCNPMKRSELAVHLLYVILCLMHWYANLAQYILALGLQRIRKVPTF